MAHLSIWSFLERQNPKATAAQALYEWGLNCDADSNPFWLFVDLIGWSSDHLGGNIRESYGSLGYTELDCLADALKEYADQPREIEDWITELMNCEGV